MPIIVHIYVHIVYIPVLPRKNEKFSGKKVLVTLGLFHLCMSSKRLAKPVIVLSEVSLETSV